MKINFFLKISLILIKNKIKHCILCIIRFTTYNYTILQALLNKTIQKYIIIYTYPLHICFSYK